MSLISVAQAQITPGTSSFSGKYFTCTKDCPPPEPGYILIGCTITINHAVAYDEGRWVPSSSPGGYVYIASQTESTVDEETGDITVEYDEILACEYWKKDKPLPPSMEEILEQMEKEELEKEKLSESISNYNQNVNYLPGFVKGLLGNEKLHIYITHLDGTKSEYASITENGVIVEGNTWLDQDSNGIHDIWQKQGIKPTMALYIDEKAIVEIINAEDPFAAFKQAWGSGIRYEGLTFASKVKKFFLDIGVKIAGLF